MAKLPSEVRILRDWYAARKAEAGDFTLKDAAAELTEIRRLIVRPHQVCNWMKHGTMGPATRQFIREKLSTKQAG